MKAHYDRQRLAEALREVGVRRGDVLFSHGNIGYFGIPAEGRSASVVCETILGAFEDAFGAEGTLVIPTFTYSFCKGQPFDPAATPSTCGAFTEWVRQHPNAVRSADPIFSVAAIGARAREMTRVAPVECFGRDSFWARFLAADGLIANLNFDAGSTFIHFVERELGVPYRYDKLFTGEIVENGAPRRSEAVFFCQDLSNPGTGAAFEPFDELARSRGLATTARVGRGAVVAIRASATRDLIARTLPERPWMLTRAGRDGVVPELRRAPELPVPALEKAAPVAEILRAISAQPRCLVSDGVCVAFEALKAVAEIDVHEYATGTKVGAQIVPELWSCRSAQLAELDGTPVATLGAGLRVAPNSESHDGELSRRELAALIDTDESDETVAPLLPWLRDRGIRIGMSARALRELRAERYRLSVSVERRFGALNVAEWRLSGSSDDCIVVACDIVAAPVGVAVAIDAFRTLSRIEPRRCGFELLIVPGALGFRAFATEDRGRVAGARAFVFVASVAGGKAVLDLERAGVATAAAMRGAVSHEEVEFGSLSYPALDGTIAERGVPELGYACAAEKLATASGTLVSLLRALEERPIHAQEAGQ
jgi:aminoglycoside 3-N-acetyltransferase